MPPDASQAPAGTSWLRLSLVGAALLAIFGLPLSYFMELPWWGGPALVAVLVGGAVLVIFGRFRAYTIASRRLGYQCELRPTTSPRSARHDPDIVISGNFRGRAFTLYRERERHARGRSYEGEDWNVVEWTDGHIRVAPFVLTVVSSRDTSALRKGVVAAMGTVRNVLGRERREVQTVPFPFESNLSRRSTLEASDADAARQFTPTACDTIDGLIKAAEIEGGEGVLVVRQHSDTPVPWIRQGKFPLPWEISRYLERADTIGRLFGS